MTAPTPDVTDAPQSTMGHAGRYGRLARAGFASGQAEVGALARILDLHRPTVGGECSVCRDREYPCATAVEAAAAIEHLVPRFQ